MKLEDLSAVDIGRRIAAREISSREVTGYFLDRARTHNGAINAFTHIAGEEALERAAEVDAQIAKAYAEFDDDARKTIVLDLQRYLAEKAYAVRWPGGKTNFDLVWPAVANYRVWNGGAADSWRIRNAYWWLDSSKAGA